MAAAPPFTRTELPAGLRFEGHAIVSADGMIADAAGDTPPALRIDADWRRFQQALGGAALVVLGRPGHRRHHNPGRERLVFTSTVEAVQPDPGDPLATLYNPAGASLATAFVALGLAQGTVAVTGGTRVFDAFLPLYDAFDLAEVNDQLLPGGRACFGAGHPRAVLASAGLVPRDFAVIDAAANVTLTRWVRPA